MSAPIRKNRTLSHMQADKFKKIIDNFESEKHLATGNTVYHRIYNTEEQNIIDLLRRLSEEAFPEGWKCEVKVEEFTNFILLAQFDKNDGKPSTPSVANYILPIITHGYPYLKNVAVYDEKHKCYLFFDENSLETIRSKGILSRKDIVDAERRGEEFSRFNSVRIDFEMIEEHMFVSVVVGGTHECKMMLDTGASMTFISEELANETVHKNESRNQTRKFFTGNGTIICPIVKRNISVGDIDRTQLVAISDYNLLGVDFFRGYNYRIVSESNCLYIWSK